MRPIVAFLGALCLACAGELPHPAPAPPPVPAVDTCPGDWITRTGPATSATDPHPTDYFRPGEPIPVDTYFTVELKRADGSKFPAGCTVTSSLYAIKLGQRVLETQSDREFHPTEDRFYKSWTIHDAGNFEVEFRDAPTRRPLATVPLEVH